MIDFFLIRNVCFVFFLKKEEQQKLCEKENKEQKEKGRNIFFIFFRACKVNFFTFFMSPENQIYFSEKEKGNYRQIL